MVHIRKRGFVGGGGGFREHIHGALLTNVALFVHILSTVSIKKLSIPQTRSFRDLQFANLLFSEVNLLQIRKYLFILLGNIGLKCYKF
jgi:hypothetical protein